MRDDTCVNCGLRIHLVKTGPLAMKWVSDIERPNTTDECKGNPLNAPQPREGDIRHRHAPASMKGTRR